MQKSQERNRVIAISAIILALTAVMGLLPFVFLLPLLFAATTQRLNVAVFAGAAFGVISLLYSFISPLPLSLIFIQSPWIPIIPRILVSLAAYGSFKLFKKLIPDNTSFKKLLPYALAGGVGTITNTVLVVGLICIEYLVLGRGGEEFRDIVLGILATIPLMAAIEFVVSLILTPTVALAYSVVQKRGLRI